MGNRDSASSSRPRTGGGALTSLESVDVSWNVVDFLLAGALFIVLVVVVSQRVEEQQRAKLLRELGAVDCRKKFVVLNAIDSAEHQENQ